MVIIKFSAKSDNLWYCPSYVVVPQYKDHKITIEDLATHRSGLPEFPGNYCPSFDPAKTAVVDSVQYRKDLMNCTKNYTFDQFYQALSNFTLSREPGSKVNIQHLVLVYSVTFWL